LVIIVIAAKQYHGVFKSINQEVNIAQGKDISGTEIKRITDPQNSSRRRAVKKIAGGITALAAYQYLPAKWEKPILESIFIPAHAQTSGNNGIAPVDPSIPVTPGHPDHPDYPFAPNHPDHPHNNPMAVIGSFTTLGITSTSAAVSVDITINRIAQYTFTLVNLQNGSSDTRDFIAQTIPVTASSTFAVEGQPGDTVELTVTNNLTSETDRAQYEIESTTTVTVLNAAGCTSTFSMGGSTDSSERFTVTIRPNPGAGQSVTVEDIKDGAAAATFTRVTDANGQIIQSIIILNTDIGSNKGVRATYQGAVGSCTVKVVA
jgi:hypothetical protein